MESKKVVVKLTGTDGNVFAIIGAVSKALVSKGFRKEADEFRSKAFGCGSYDEVIRLAMSTVTVR